eukprot:scaffold5808_cov21-Prasinocladus_malaysianus.AAC.1
MQLLRCQNCQVAILLVCSQVAITGAPGLTDEDVINLFTHCRSLQSINFAKCANVTDRCVVVFDVVIAPLAIAGIGYQLPLLNDTA